MTTKVQRWGNGQGLRLSRPILEDARISVGVPVAFWLLVPPIRIDSPPSPAPPAAPERKVPDTS